jgi:hypothetical protein
MPTARELLRQADALMRRNRRRGRYKGGNDTTLPGEGIDVPTLTDALAVDATAPLTPTVILPEHGDALGVDPISLDTLSDLPVLTDAVEGVTFVDATHALAPDVLAAPVALTAPDALAASDAMRAAPSPASFVDGDFILEIPPEENREPADTAVVSGASTVPAAPDVANHAGEATAAAEGPDLDAMADEIRAQVMQQLDLFTDAGLREQLGARLKPIVERAGAELVDTINQHVGQLMRSYVAEAIEREIDRWKSAHR